MKKARAALKTGSPRPVKPVIGSRRESRRAFRLTVVLLGIAVGQLILYGASFAGAKILLPLEILKRPGIYIPLKPSEYLHPDNAQGGSVTDPVFEDEPARVFRNAELRAGRLPTWNPYQYTGVPSVSFLSPFAIFGALVRSPRILPFLALLLAIVSGSGAYLFARRVLRVGVWPATLAAWLYPVTGFFIFWQSTSLAHPIVWLPWLLCAVDDVLSQSNPWAFARLALATMLTLVSGHLDMAGMALIVTALFALWDFLFLFRSRALRRPTWARFWLVPMAFVLGFMLASSELVHAIQYARTGSRIQERGAGREERPPIGIASLPQLVMPHIYGSTERNSFAFLPEKEPNLVETPASGFAGLIATLVAAPLAWGSRRHRSVTVFLAVIALLGMAWCLDLPIITSLMRFPGLNLFSFNRFVFATCFAIVSLAAIGFEELSQSNWRWHNLYYIPILLLAVTAIYCGFRTFVLPSMLSEALPQAIADGSPQQWVRDSGDVRIVQAWFTRMYLTNALICLIGLAAWIYLRVTKKRSAQSLLIFGALAFGELLFFAHGLTAQCHPSMYYPPLLPLETIANSPPARVITYQCLPANLLQVRGLSDVRGYDGVDPAQIVDLLGLAAGPNNVELPHAAVQCFTPQIADGAAPGTVQLPPVLNLLGVRYVIIPAEDDTSYRLFLNPGALPRAFVPRSVEVVPDRVNRLKRIGSSDFDPRQTAFVEEPLDVPASVQGEALIAEETSQQISIRAKMAQPGLVMLADQWNTGWRAYIGDKSVPILRVDHALRGVLAPAGESTIVFRYQPGSLQWGIVVALVAIVLLIVDGWTGFSARLSA